MVTQQLAHTTPLTPTAPDASALASATLTATLADRIVGLGIAAEVGFALIDVTGTPQLGASSHLAAVRLTRSQIEHGEGPSHDCCVTGLAASSSDLARAQGRWPTFTAQAIAAGFRSVHAVPLRLRGEVLGAMTMFLTTPGGIAPGGLSVVRAMADVATIGLQQERDLERARDVESQLTRALLSRIQIEQAKGIISEQAQVTPDAAFLLLRRYARDRNHRLVEVAAEVVARTTTSDDLNGRCASGAAPDGASGARDDTSPRDTTSGT